MNDTLWQQWLERLYSLRRDKSGAHERPHKPVLLLSIIDLLDRGVIRANEVPLSEELVKTFKRYFEVVRKLNDKPSIENPFYFLSGDKFWTLVPQKGGEPLYREGFASGAPGIGQLRKQVAFGQFDDGLWSLLGHDVSRHQLREALIARYFPEQHDQLVALVVQPSAPTPALLNDALPPAPARDAAFRHTILEVYDFRCAACGVRVLLDQAMSLAEAAQFDSVLGEPQRHADERLGAVSESSLGDGQASDRAVPGREATRRHLACPPEAAGQKNRGAARTRGVARPGRHPAERGKILPRRGIAAVARKASRHHVLEAHGRQYFSKRAANGASGVRSYRG